MLHRLFYVVVLTAATIVSVQAQTVRFDTNVGTFDMELNPTGNPGLQGHVDNLLAYVESGRFKQVVVNRAPADFVIQMAGFTTDTLTLPENFSDFPAVPSFGDVIVDEDLDGTPDFDITGLTNTRGTVSLALSGPLNSGSSSFFINLGDNTGSLDPQGFIPFANINDMATIDLILSLEQTSLPDGDIASSDIPILSNNRLVVVEDVFVLEPPVMFAAASASTSTESDFTSGETAFRPASSASFASVPEPPAMVVAVGMFMLIAVFYRRSI